MSVCRDWIFKEIYKNNKLTKSARIVFLYLCAHCAENGKIAIYHSDIENDIGIDTATFYRAITRLANTTVSYTLPNRTNVSSPMIIKEPKSKDCKAEMIITIPYNDFTVSYSKGKEYANYVSLDYEGLKGTYLRKFRHVELRIMLYFFYRGFKAGHVSEYCVFKSKGTAYKAIADQLALRIYTVRRSIARLIKNNEIAFATTAEVNSYPWNSQQKKLKKGNITYCIYSTFREEIFVEVTTSRKDEYGSRTVDPVYNEKHFRSDRHMLRNILRRQKRAEYDCWSECKQEQDIIDITVLMHQYRANARKRKKKINIESVFSKAISQCVLVTAKFLHQELKNILLKNNFYNYIPD